MDIAGGVPTQVSRGDMATDVFRARRLCAAAFERTLVTLFGRRSVTEIAFRDAWLTEISSSMEMTKDGWYSPPLKGASVLAAPSTSAARLRFRSLRDPLSFPSDQLVNWQDGFLYVYCSNLSTETRFPGDFSLTLYFGRDDGILRYFRTAHEAARTLALQSLELVTSAQVFQLGQELLSRNNLVNTVHSVTDVSPLDFGHSLHRVQDHLRISRDELSPNVRQHVSGSRRFINAVTDWSLSEVDAYTIEPQIIPSNDSDLPKVSVHYLLTQHHGSAIDSTTDRLLEKYLGEPR